MANLPRPGLPHTFSQQLSNHRGSRDERRPLLPSSTFPRDSRGSLSGSRSNTNPAASDANFGPLSNPTPDITLNESSDDYDDDEEEHADSDGLYPPHCCFTTTDAPTEGVRKRADPFQTSLCKVYLNIHRVAVRSPQYMYPTRQNPHHPDTLNTLDLTLQLLICLVDARVETNHAAASIRRDIINSIDDPYSLDQLKAPRMNISVIRPLVDEYYGLQDLSIVYCLLVNRLQFIRDQSYHTHHQTVNLTRALLCEVLAEKIIRRYNEQNPGPRGLLKLATILVGGFDPFAHAPEEVLKHADRPHAVHWFVREQAWGSNDGKPTALEVAILSESKSFLASSACQKVVDAIYRGKVVYSPNSFMDIIPDKWKKRPISLYDPRRGPILNQYRLFVPRTRNVMELVHFAVLLGLYLAVMEQRETRLSAHYGLIEVIFDVYSAGWVLDQVASILEHGWQVYTQNLWSFLDVMFSGIFLVYLVLRLHGLGISDGEASRRWATTSLDVLSCAAPVLIPRLAFNVMSENLLFVSLRAMMSDFMTLTILAVWSFAGFLLSLKWLHSGVHQPITISKWMIWIWFGLDGTGIDESPDFHWLLGPALMILFAFLGNTLFLTILVSMLSNTFSMIVRNAVQEIQFRRAVLTLEGVKADAIFAYFPPFNILALIIFLPLKLIVSPRTFHKVNVAAVKTLNLPLLLLIAWYERRTLWVSDKRKHFKPSRIDWANPFGPRAAGKGWWARTMTFWDFSKFSAHGDIQTVFEIHPPEDILDQDDNQQDEESKPTSGIGKTLLDRFKNQFRTPGDSAMGAPRKMSAHPKHKKKRRRDSSLTAATQTSSLSRSKSAEARLKKEFADSESGEEGGDEKHRSHPHGHRKIKRGERMDSLVDFSDNAQVGLQEANARLHKMEQSLQRLEDLVMQLVEGGTSTGDNESAENELVEQKSAGVMD